ncbi:MAG: hypothetical protein WDZ75_02005 [Candidatus Paceibacterota bacterium]
MVNVLQSNTPTIPTNDSTSELEAERVRNRRGLRTLAHDLAELKRNKQNQNQKAPAVPQKDVTPPVQQRANQTPTAQFSVTQQQPPSQQQSTHYREELEKLAAKYIPEKKQVGNKPAQEAGPTSSSNDALKSFEMNKAFNDQLHKKVAPQEDKTEKQSQKITGPANQQTSPSPKPIEQTKPHVEQPKPAEKENPKSESKPVEKNPENKLTDLTEEDITRELERVLHKQEQKSEEQKEPRETEGEKKPEKKERPHTSIKQLEENLRDLTQRIQSSVSRIETYHEEERAANTSLKNLFERRDIINKNLDPIKEKERSVLITIKKHEEKESSATNKIERRDAENRRWERENERRELEDERWKLEEIYEKLRLVIEKTEHELASIKKKLSEEELHKRETEAEKIIYETHKNLLSKREEEEKALHKRKEIENEITNLKNELKVIRSNEEGLEKEKRDIESKIGGLNDLSIKRSLEKERRGIEDELHGIEESRWSKEDELKKYYAEKDEKDREHNLLTTELESLENKFEELESAKHLR